jgi:hypothetical protein
MLIHVGRVPAAFRTRAGAMQRARAGEPFFTVRTKIGAPCLPRRAMADDAPGTSAKGHPMHHIAMQRISLFATAAAFVFLAGIVLGLI